jgi:hypothetical protein
VEREIYIYIYNIYIHIYICTYGPFSIAICIFTSKALDFPSGLEDLEDHVVWLFPGARRVGVSIVMGVSSKYGY